MRVKIIVSSAQLLKQLSGLGLPTEHYTSVVIEKGKITFGENTTLSIEQNHIGEFTIENESISRLIRVLNCFSDQPITIAFSDTNGIFIESIIL